MKHYISLKWQALLVISLVMLFGGSLFAAFGQREVERAFEYDRARAYEDRRRAVHAALDNLQAQLVKLASHMQGLLQEALPHQQAESLADVIDANWGMMNFEWGVDRASIVSADGQLVSSWGGEIDVESVPGVWRSSVLEDERPSTHVWCEETCYALALVPVFFTDGSTGVMYLASALGEAILYFKSLTSTNVGLLAKLSGESAEREKLGRWDMDVVSLTESQQILPVLQRVADRTSMAALASGQGSVVEEGGRSYEVRLIPLGTGKQAQIPYLTVIDDITDAVEMVRETLNFYLLVALVMATAIAGILQLVLWRPMGLVQKVASLLPLLAGDQRDRAQNQLEASDRRFFLGSEIGSLFRASIMLSKTLRRLDVEVRERSEHLRRRRQELLDERNFVTRLLNHVHVVILSQNERGELYLVNAEGRRLLGLEEFKSGGDRFVDHLSTEEVEVFQSSVERLLKGGAAECRQEVEFRRGSGDLVPIEWYHSVLPASDETQASILSVGLDLTERRKAEANLAWLADHDPLTELYNRRRFHSEFRRALKSAQRSGSEGAVVIFDVDQFKTVNDTGGHMVGDVILQQVAWRLRSALRSTDILARLGGDEFALLVEQTDESGVEDLLTKICDQFQSVDIEVDEVCYRVSVSMGIALFPDHGTTVEALMANADFAMYAAKEENHARNSWKVFSGTGMEQTELRESINWKVRIQDALENDRLILHFQPILDVKSGGISHYEALVRMLGEDGEIVPPGKFIPIAEKTGLIYEIDLRVVELAVKALKQFREDGRPICLAVNLSARAIINNDYIEYVNKIVIDAGLQPSDLMFELTETSAVEDVGHAAELIREFRRRGFRFSLDDFGVGFSSWYYLRQLSVDYVKLDGSFVKNMAVDYEDRLFVQSINTVVQGLGKKSVAEFVGDRETLKLLSQLGVDYAQGFYIGRPQPQLLDADYILEF